MEDSKEDSPRVEEISMELLKVVYGRMEREGPEVLVDLFEALSANVALVLSYMPDWLRRRLLEDHEKELLKSANDAGGAVGLVEGASGRLSKAEDYENAEIPHRR